MRFSEKYYREKRGIYAGMDMGTTNTAFAVTEQCGNNIKILYADMIPPHILIRDFELEGAWQRIIRFKKYIAKLLDIYKPLVLAGELFYLRGFRTNHGTPINFMLGIVASLCHERGIKFVGVNAGTWKGVAWLKQKITIEELYPYSPVKHLTDSVAISLYANKSVLEMLNEKDLIELVKALPQPTVRTTLKTPAKRKPKAKTAKPSKKSKSKVKVKPSRSVRSARSSSVARAR